MLNVFTPMKRAARPQQRLAYRSFLADRDGVPDLEQRTLSRREESLSRFLRPLAAERELDRAAFYAQYERFDPTSPTSPETLLLLTLVKVNAAEAFGVNSTYEQARSRADANEDDLEVVLLIEESYHTKILLSSARLYGMDVQAPYTPPTALRTLIGGIAHTPEFLSRPLILASEIFGTLSFLKLLQAAGTVLKHDPELRDAVEERLTEVLIDEIGHVSFNRMCLGHAGLAQARVLLPLVARGLRNAIPEFAALGIDLSCDGAEQITTSTHLPEAVRRAAFVA
ncbi:MAG TPA: hypothetical protein VER33_17600 [Polyangiaceae bacterium]|nr:hypothetical protein [Polyangiaceae bacterium]